MKPEPSLALGMDEVRRLLQWPETLAHWTRADEELRNKLFVFALPSRPTLSRADVEIVLQWSQGGIYGIPKEGFDASDKLLARLHAWHDASATDDDLPASSDGTKYTQ